MHHYQFNIGDYRRKTGHLTHVEHSIYRSLIDTYMLTELPLDPDLKTLMRAHNVRTDEEERGLQNVLDDFFIITDKGYHHDHCQQVLNEIYAKSDKARESARKRWEKERLKREQKTCGKDANASKTNANASKSDANGMLEPCESHATHYPLPINPLPNKNTLSSDKPNDHDLFNQDLKDVDQEEHKGPPPCPHQKIVDSYHKNCLGLPQVKILSDARKKTLQSRWRQDERHQTLEFWDKYFALVSRSDFLMGKSTTWKAGFDWLITSAKFVNVIEGNYDNNKSNGNGR